MKNVALITGASSGIGSEFAKIHAKKGGDLVLVARSEEKLNQLKQDLQQRHNIDVVVIVMDLSRVGSAKELFKATEALGVSVDVLINNAGFGGHGSFHERDLARDEAMMQLNMNTLTSLTHLYLAHMLKQKKGKILNVASTAAFMPGPLQAVYYATKAYVLSFSQAIAEELNGTGVSVTALCPGTVRTNFVTEANLEGVKVFENAASASSVARCGYNAMEKGQLVIINVGMLSFVLNWIFPLLPRKTVLKISKRIMEKST